MKLLSSVSYWRRLSYFRRFRATWSLDRDSIGEVVAVGDPRLIDAAIAVLAEEKP